MSSLEQTNRVLEEKSTMTHFYSDSNPNSGRGAHVRVRMGGLCVHASLGLD